MSYCTIKLDKAEHDVMIKALKLYQDFCLYRLTIGDNEGSFVDGMTATDMLTYIERMQERRKQLAKSREK